MEAPPWHQVTLAYLSGSREGGAGVHPGPVPGGLVHHRGGGVPRHLRGADAGPDGGPPSPAWHRAGGPQVGLDVRVAVRLLAVDFTEGGKEYRIGLRSVGYNTS